MTSTEPPIPVLTGPTACGKTGLALALAEQCDEDVEILSMDSMAVFRQMDVGTAKPSPEERSRVPHHLIDVVDPNEEFDTHRYCRLAEQALADLRARGKRPLFVGGTPLYLMAFFKGMLEGAGKDPALRRQLEEEERAEPGSLHRRLEQEDPEAAARIHRNDLRRLVRAHEVRLLTGQPISAQQDAFAAAGWRIPCRVVALQRSREELHDRVNRRTRAMLAAGLVEETRAIRDGCGFGPQARAAIGYAECLRWLDGGFKDDEEVRNRIRRATHGLIRRQTTWLRRLPDLRWISPDQDPATIAASLFE